MSRPSASGPPGASGIDGPPHHFQRLWEASGKQLLFGEYSHFSAHPTPTLLPTLLSTILEPHAATWRQVSQPSSLGSQLIQPIPWSIDGTHPRAHGHSSGLDEVGEQYNLTGLHRLSVFLFFVASTRQHRIRWILVGCLWLPLPPWAAMMHQSHTGQ